MEPTRSCRKIVAGTFVDGLVIVGLAARVSAGLRDETKRIKVIAMNEIKFVFIFTSPKAQAEAPCGEAFPPGPI